MEKDEVEDVLAHIAKDADLFSRIMKVARKVKKQGDF